MRNFFYYEKKMKFKNLKWKFTGAIEKLVYRIDHLEKRVRKTEELLYYVIAGNNKMKGKIALLF